MRILVAATMLALAGCGTTSEGAAKAASESSLVALTIESQGKRHAFKVEVARTAEEQSRGLMFRERLAPDRGMIFPLNPPRYASFWMKNTLIPLDMIFVRADGTIANIAENTVPHSLTPVASDEPVAAVLEIPGGRSAELGIRPDDKVVWTDKR